MGGRRLAGDGGGVGWQRLRAEMRGGGGGGEVCHCRREAVCHGLSEGGSVLSRGRAEVSECDA